MLQTLCLLAALAGSPSGSACEPLAAKFDAAGTTDPAHLLALGRECEKAGCARLARLAYEKVLKIERKAAGKDSWCEASFRLAKIELAANKYDAAFTRLRRVVAICDHAEARAFLKKAESAKTRQQVLLVQQGDNDVERGDLDEALKKYEKAYELLPQKPSAAAYVPRGEILKKLAECRSRIDDMRYRREFLPRNRSVVPCPVCSRGKTHGFLPCRRCQGTGKIKEWRMVVSTAGMLRKRLVDVPCTKCGGRGYVGCSACYGLGYTSSKITSREKKALKDLVRSVVSPRMLASPLARDIQAVETKLLTVKEGASLNYLRAMRPDYSLALGVKKAMGPAPPLDAALSKASQEWKKVSHDDRAKVSFLLNYACEFADYIRHFDMLRGSRKPDVASLLDARPGTGDPLTPELIAAFPDISRSSCIEVRGFLERCGEGTPGSNEYKGYVHLAGETANGVRFFAWKPDARPQLARLASGPWKRSLANLVEDYPFDLWKKLLAAPADHEITLAGRFLRAPFTYPRNWFEVWRFEVGLSRAQKRAFLALRDPVDISFPRHSLRQVAGVLREWFDLEVTFEGVADTTLVSCKSENCPKGLVIDALAVKALGAAWFYEADHVVVCPKGKSPHSDDTAAVLARLEAEKAADASVSAQRLRQEESPARELPADPAGLRVAARQAVLAMNYAVAERCFQALEKLARDPIDKKIAARARDKMRLCDELTGKTPVSRLADAPELTRIAYQKPSGDLVWATVILDDKGDSWSVQEAYGASFSIRPEKIMRRVNVPASQWRREKTRELEVKERDALQTDAPQRAGRLFLLALFAKTNRFARQGARFLNQAVESPEFETFLRRLFPRRSDSLAALWRSATGRLPLQEKPATAPAPAPVEVKPALQAVLDEPIEPLPSGLSDGQLLSHARRYASEGSRCTRKVLEGESAAAWRKRAIEYFTRAKEAMVLFLERRPGDPAGTRLKRDIQAMIDACKKDMGFFE